MPSKPLPSVTRIAESLRAEKARSKAARPPNVFKSNAIAIDSSSSDTSSDSSTSDSEEGLMQAKRKLLKKQAARTAAMGANLNGTKKPEPATKVIPPTAPHNKQPKHNPGSTDSDSDSESKNKKLDKKVGKTGKTGAAARSPSRSGSASSRSTNSSGISSDNEREERTTGKSTTTMAGLKKSQAVQDSEVDSCGSEPEHGNGDGEVDPVAIARINGITNLSSATTKLTTNGVHFPDQDSQLVDRTRQAESNCPVCISNGDFIIRKASSDQPGKEIADFFSKENLKDKQVWYFTAPASLPITIIEDMEIDLAKASVGGTLLNHEGDAYSLDLEPYTTSTQIQLLVPSIGGEKYSTIKHGIDSTIHVRRTGEFGPDSKVKATATDQYVRNPPRPREQPQNLKTRFTPIGVPTLTASSTPLPAASLPGKGLDVDMDDASVIAPIMTHTHLKRKRPMAEESGKDEEEQPKKKHTSEVPSLAGSEAAQSAEAKAARKEAKAAKKAKAADSKNEAEAANVKSDAKAAKNEAKTAAKEAKAEAKAKARAAKATDKAPKPSQKSGTGSPATSVPAPLASASSHENGAKGASKIISSTPVPVPVSVRLPVLPPLSSVSSPAINGSFAQKTTPIPPPQNPLLTRIKNSTAKGTSPKGTPSKGTPSKPPRASRTPATASKKQTTDKPSKIGTYVPPGGLKVTAVPPPQLGSSANR